MSIGMPGKNLCNVTTDCRRDDKNGAARSSLLRILGNTAATDNTSL